jgi:Tfp pilus assembly protein PilP
MTAHTASLIVFIVAATAIDANQAPVASTPAPVAAADSAPAPPPNYEYQGEGRRDPFLSVIHARTDRVTVSAKGARPDGVAGILVEDVLVRGIVQSRGTWMALIAAPNGRTYTIRAGDRLMDGSVRAITGQAVVMMQQPNDPLSLDAQREVRKPLRGEVR